MILKKLSMSRYRNYDALDFSVKHNVNLFVGPNAQGKTNLLEAIYVLALTKSHRTHQDKELIAWQHDETRLYAEVEKKYGSAKLSLTIGPKGKRAKINGLEQRKLSDFIGTLNVVMFAPEDLEIVKGSPGVRRRFLDMELAQVSPAYLHASMQYQKVLSQRNRFLKQMSAGNPADSALLEVWNEQLAEYGVKMMKKRQNFIGKLQKWAETIHAGITNGLETLRIEYLPSFDMHPDEEETILIDRFMVKLTQTKEQEIRRGVTLTGPHRDDMAFYINDKEVHLYGSQGQQRTTALSLKLAEIELICEETGEYPLLLLDDVLSELDKTRQNQLIETFQGKVQTFVTATDIGNIDLGQLRDAAVYQVRQGQIID